MIKSDLRKLYLTRQKALSTEEMAKKSSLVAERFFQSSDLNAVRYLHCFIPIQKFNEINTDPIFERVWNDFPHIETLVPKVVLLTREMENVAYTRDTRFVENSWGIRQPTGGVRTETGILDMILVPGLAFDRSGHRVGYGKGFYDRLLAGCRKDCIKIGLNYFDPVERINDTDTHDIRLDIVITPDQTITFA